MQQRANRAKLAAISAAVTKYIQTQEEDLMSAAELAPAISVPLAAASLYSVSGRLQMMDARRLLSLRLGRR
jgi:hypothetical protein